MTVSQSKHLLNPGSAMPGVIEYGQDNDGVASLSCVVYHASISILYCYLPLLDIGYCRIIITCSMIDSLIKGGHFGTSHPPWPRSRALYS